jgi:hypothetical protein
VSVLTIRHSLVNGRHDLQSKNKAGKYTDTGGFLLCRSSSFTVARPPRAGLAGCRFDPAGDAVVPGTGKKSLTFRLVSDAGPHNFLDMQER